MSIFKILYDSIIEKRKQFTSFGNLEYWEKHHIVPKCLNGTDEESNLVLLTAREHYIAHWLLTKIYPENKNLKHAFVAMFWGRKDKLTSKQYEIIREYFGKLMRNRAVSIETRKKISEARKGRKHINEKNYETRYLSLKGAPKSIEYKKKMKEIQLSIWKNEELLQRHAAELKIKMNSPEVRKNLLIAFDKQRDYYLIVTPIGTEYIIKGLSLFARLNNLQQSKLSQVNLGSRKHTCGVWCKRIDDLICLYDIDDNVILKEDEKLTKEQSIKFGALKRKVPNMKNATPGSKCSKYK